MPSKYNELDAFLAIPDEPQVAPVAPKPKYDELDRFLALPDQPEPIAPGVQDDAGWLKKKARTLGTGLVDWTANVAGSPSISGSKGLIQVAKDWRETGKAPSLWEVATEPVIGGLYKPETAQRVRETIKGVVPESWRRTAEAEAAREIPSPLKDPLGFLDVATSMTAANAGNIAAGAAGRSPAGIALAAVAMADQEAGSFVDSWAKTGLPVDFVSRYAKTYGLLSAPIEYAQSVMLAGRGGVGKVAGKIPGIKAATGAVGKMAGRFLGTAAGKAILKALDISTEGVEEVTQGWIENQVAQKMAQDWNKAHPESPMQVPAWTTDDAWQAFKGGAGMGIIMEGGRAALNLAGRSVMGAPGPGVTETAPGTPPPAQEQAEAQLDAETEALFRQAEAEQAAQEAQGGVIQPQARQMPDLTPVAPYAAAEGIEPTMPAAELEGIMQGAVGDIRAENRAQDAAGRVEAARSISDLADRIARGDKQFTDADLQLQNNYPKEIEAALKQRMRAQERAAQAERVDLQGLQQQVADILARRAATLPPVEPVKPGTQTVDVGRGIPPVVGGVPVTPAPVQPATPPSATGKENSVQPGTPAMTTEEAGVPRSREAGGSPQVLQQPSTTTMRERMDALKKTGMSNEAALVVVRKEDDAAKARMRDQFNEGDEITLDDGTELVVEMEKGRKVANIIAGRYKDGKAYGGNNGYGLEVDSGHHLFGIVGKKIADVKRMGTESQGVPAPHPAVAEVTPQQGGVTPKPPAITSPATLARALTANPDMDLTGVKDEWLPVAATKVKGELKAKVQGEIERRKQPAPSAKPQELMTPDEYLASQKLRTAIRYPDGEIVVGNPGEIHAMVAARSGFENKGIPESGWWKDGKYLRPNEAKAIQGQGDALRSQQDARQKHEVALTMAQVNRKPVSAAAVDAYGIKLPPGYVREGDRYVFKGAPAPAQGGGQDVTEQADTEPPRIASTPVEEVNIADIKLSKDVPNFKRDADTETGEVRGQELKGKTYSRLPVNPVTVWERLNGARELITGRHRFALAKRLGEKTIPAQVVREADGFTKEMALTFDAEANIRDNQGSTEDHATYFRNTDISEEEASSRGLLDRDKGRKGWNIGKNASDDLYALYQIGGISDAKADAIARAGKGNADLQSVGIGYAKGHDVDQIIAYMQAVGASKPRGQQLDMFGRDSAWQQEADAIGKAVVEVKNELRAELTALRAAKTAGKEKNAATLKKYGFKAGDVKKVDARIEDLTRLAEEWDRWVTDPQKVAIARQRAGLKPNFDTAPLIQEADMPFNLTGEKAKSERSAQAEQQEAARAKVEQDKKQGPLFARGGSGPGLPRATYDAAVQAESRVMPMGEKAQAFDRLEDAPQDVQGAVARGTATVLGKDTRGRVRAVTLGDRSYFFLDRYGNDGELRQDIREEFFHRIENEYSGYSKASRLGTLTYGGKWGVIKAEITRNYGYKPGEDGFFRELAAKAYRDGLTNRTVWGRFVDALVATVKDMARRVGMKLDLSDAEIRDHVNGVLRAKMEGQGGTEGGGVLRTSNATITRPGQQPAYMVRAYHGTPYTFEPEPDAPFGKVKKEKVGTGEGAAAYGWGVAYVSENIEVARAYSDKLRPRNMTQSEYNMAAYLGNLPKSIYHVELSFDPEDCLDWDKPLAEQSEKVRKALRDAGVLRNYQGDEVVDTSKGSWRTANALDGAGLYSLLIGRLENSYDTAEKRSGSQAASEYLASLGIKGIRYADQGSRTPKTWKVAETGNGKYIAYNDVDGETSQPWTKRQDALDDAARRSQPTYNFVVFNEQDIRVVGRNGETLSPTDAMEPKAQFAMSEANIDDEQGVTRINKDTITAEREAKEAAEAKAKAEANKPPPKPTNVPMDTTGDMFDQSKADFPLFATPTPKQEAPGTQTAEIPAILDAALRWQGAHMNAEVEYKERGDKRGQYQIASESGKSVLDSYLMKRFGIDRNAAHEITNEITQRNLAPIRDAKVDEFAGEPWADKTIADRRPPGPGTRGGPSAAAASGTLEFIPRAKESGSDYTGLQRAISDLERESLGLPPYTVDAARRFPDIVESVWANMQANSDYAAQLNDELRDTPRPVSDSEAATLLILKVQRFNERNAAAQANDPARIKEAQAKLESTFDAISRAGTETGRALNAFKMAMDERYSLVELEASLRASKGGESATTEELAKLRKVADEYARANRELNDRMAKLSESQTAANEALKAKDEELRNAKMKEEFARLILAKMPPYQASKKPTPRIVEFATARANAARERMKARSGQLFAGVDPQVITDLADIGMEYIVKGAVDLMQFTDRMVKDFGEKVRPYLQDVHAAAMKMLGHEQGRERVEASKRKVPQGDKAPTEQPGYDPATIKELFKDQADMGVTDPQEALTAVHEIIKETNPAMTREQVRDSFSDYGKVKPPSADPVKQTLADWRRQYQLLASIELVAKRLEPLKPGLRRQKPSATVRELTRKLNKMMKEAGINPIDPQTQLASALSGIKSRLENRIEELSKALATGERITLDKNAVPYDEQAKALAAERDELQAMYDQAFPPKPPTYDQQVNLALKAAERNLSALNKRLEDARMGKFTGRPLKPSSVWTAELADLKNQQKAIREEIEQLKEAANPKKSPELLAIEQRRKRDEAVIRELERRIREKDFEPRQSKFIDISGDPEAMAAAERKAKVRAEFAQLKEEARRSKLGKFDKLKEWGIRVYDLSRDTKSSFDVSAPGRQGYPVLFINTKIWANATRAMFKGMRRENSAVLMQRIRERPAYRKGWYRFLALSEDDGMGNYSNVDDRFQLAVINHVPGLAASNRAYAVFLNELRVNLFDYLMEQMPNPQNPSIADLKAVSEDVNIFTGKGKLPGGSAVGASRILYAPSFIKASWDIITGKPMRTGNIPLRNLMARQYAKVLLGTAALVSMASMWGGDDDEGVEYDMTSSDFGTVKFGHYRVGLVSYLRPMLTYMARKIQGYKKVEKNGRIEYVRLTDDVPAWVDESELTAKVPYGGGMDQVDWQFLKSKLHPGISAIRSMISGQDFGGRKIGKAEAVYQMFAPITAEQIREMSKTENIDALVMLTILNAFGFDVRPDYNDPTIKKQLNEERNK